MTWCWRCGRYSTDRAHGLKLECHGQPGHGQSYRLKRLKKGRHPVANIVLEGATKRMLARFKRVACGISPLFLRLT